MLKLAFGRGLLMALVVLLGSPAAADTPLRLGLFAGFANYTRTPDWPNLPETVRDATDMRAMFTGWGYQAKDALIDPSRQQLQDALSELGRQVRAAPPGSMVVVYISSHGFGYRGDNFVVPGDAGTFDDISFSDRTISVTQILEKLGTRENVTRIVILDMCRDGALSKGGPGFLRGKNNEPMTAPVDRGRTPPSGTLVVYSSGYGQRSLPALGSARNSLFTEVALSMFREKPDTLFYDVFYDVRDLVARRSGGSQVPVFEGAARGFSLKPVASPSPGDLAASAFMQAVRSRDPERLRAFIQDFPSAADQVADARTLLGDWTRTPTVPSPAGPDTSRNALPSDLRQPPRPEPGTERPGRPETKASSLSAGNPPQSAEMASGASPIVVTSLIAPPRRSISMTEDEILSEELPARIAALGGKMLPDDFPLVKAFDCIPMRKISPEIDCAQRWEIPNDELIRKLEGIAASGNDDEALDALRNLVMLYGFGFFYSPGRKAYLAPADAYLEEIQRRTEFAEDKYPLIEAAYNLGRGYAANYDDRESSWRRPPKLYAMAWELGGTRSHLSRQAGLRLAQSLENGWSGGSKDPVGAYKILRMLPNELPLERRAFFEEVNRVVSYRGATR